MIKVRLHGEPAEIEKLIEIICNGFPAVRVLSISRNYKDRAELIKIINKASS